MHVSLMSLWLPIVLSAVIVFIASSVIHMLLKYHDSDWQKLPDEDAVRGALQGAAPGEYTVPHAASQADRNNPEWQEKFKQGPAALLVVMQHGSLAMGKQLLLWFVYCILASFLVAYVTSVALPAGTDYLTVFRIVGTVAVLCYAGAAPIGSIWFGHSWSYSLKSIADGLVYGLATAGVFGWLWP